MNDRRRREGSHWLPLALSLAGTAAGVYLFALRPRLARWGASDDEVSEPLPGDDLVPDPNLASTRAVTIHARPAEVWPWLVQVGQGRGGFYTYDWLENLMGLEMRSAERILPEHQWLAAGDIVALEPAGSGFRVWAAKPERFLVLYVDGTSPGLMGQEMARAGGASTWTWVLREAPGGATRLVARWRMRYAWRPQDPQALAVRLALEPAAFVMERGMLLGLKARAERAAPPL